MIVKSLFSIQRSLDRSIPISSKISRAKIQGSNDLAIKICTQPLKSNTKEAIEQEQDRILLLFPFLDFSRRSIRSEPRRIVYFSPYIHQCNTDIKIFVSFAWNLGYPSPFSSSSCLVFVEERESGFICAHVHRSSISTNRKLTVNPGS